MSPTCASGRANSTSRSPSSSDALRATSRCSDAAPSPRVQLEEARLELQGLQRPPRRARQGRAREPEALVAPVSGVIAEGTPVAGQIAHSNAVVFQIVDPARLWVEALSFEAVAPARNGARASTATGKS